MIKTISSLLLIVLLLSLSACRTDNTSKKQEEQKVVQKDPVRIPAFNADSAYAFVQKQVDFGPRVPGTDAHKQCGDWFVQKLRSYGADVIEQDFIAEIYTGDRWESRNIIGQINPDHKDRIILSAHWDSRFMSDMDENDTKSPVLGADDGGSGVGILLEIARILQENPIDLGVDIILWDAEDQGQSGGVNNESWALGSQHWSRNKHRKDYFPKYGINLDMVGAANPSFGQDNFSRRYAKDVLDRVWKLAQRMNHGSMFKNHSTGEILDDHVFVNMIARIPMIDIINQPRSPRGFGFQKCWHKQCDDMSGISKKTLGAVGQVVTAVTYKESDGSIYTIQ